MVVANRTVPFYRPGGKHTAETQLKTHIASLQQVLCDPKLAGPEHARRYSDRLEEFTPLFVDFLEPAYMGTSEENGDANIEYMREILDGKQVEIKTKTRLRNGDRYSVDYKLYLSPAGWARL